MPSSATGLSRSCATTRWSTRHQRSPCARRLVATAKPTEPSPTGAVTELSKRPLAAKSRSCGDLRFVPVDEPFFSSEASGVGSITAVRRFIPPWRFTITSPPSDQTFWSNLIGRGYPTPNRQFRWCVDRLKIAPTTASMQRPGGVILLLGVRSDESSTRAASVERYRSESRLSPHNTMAGAMVYAPLRDLLTTEVWAYLLQRPPPWGGTHRSLWTLYRNAAAGECPIVTSKSDAPSCGSSSSRFGCWTCTVVTKDHSLAGMVSAGVEDLELEFRDWLASIRDDPTRRRQKVNRKSQQKLQRKERGSQLALVVDTRPQPGPFTRAARREILDRLQVLEVEVGRRLVTDDELRCIAELWAADEALHPDDSSLEQCT